MNFRDHKTTTKQSKFNWVKVDQTLLIPDIERLVEYFQCHELVQTLHYQRELSEFMRLPEVKRAVQEMPNDYLRGTSRPMFDLLIPAQERDRLKNEFGETLKRGLDSFIDQSMKERNDSVVNKPKYRDDLIEDFVADYVAIRSIIRIDAIKNKIPATTIQSTIQSIIDFRKSKQLSQSIPDYLILKERELNDESRGTVMATKKLLPLKKDYKKIKRDFDLVLKRISKLKSLDENKERLSKLIIERDKLAVILRRQFLMIDFFSEESSVNKKANQIEFREKWMTLISNYFQTKFLLSPDSLVVRKVVGFLFFEIGLGLKSSKREQSLLDAQGQWAGKKWPK